MAQFDVVDMNGKKVSTVELSDAVFGITPNEKSSAWLCSAPCLTRLPTAT